MSDVTVTTTHAGPGFYSAVVRFGPDPDQAFRDIIRALKIDEHEADCVAEWQDGTKTDLYEAWLQGDYAGCYSCVAAYIARAALERRHYPPPRFDLDDSGTTTDTPAA